MPTVQQALEHGWNVHQSGNVAAAESIYRQVLAQVPGNANALVYLGIALFDQRRFQESSDSYRAAIEKQPQFPIAWNNLGNTLRMLGRVDEAEECFAKALSQQPGYMSALKNRGTLWIWTGEIERGLQWYEQGLKVDPNNAELHRNLGVIYLLQGRFDEGWKEYRWRWKMPGMNRPVMTAPLWQGEPLAGKSIALYPEQGLGDTIQFIRTAKLLKDQGATTLVSCKQNLIPLLSSVPGIDQLYPDNAVIPPVDFHASLIDVVDVLYHQNNAVPHGAELFDGGGYLSVSETLQDDWRRWLDDQIPKPSDRSLRVGINWQGNPQHHADVYRSIPLADLAPLAEIPEVSLVSLQFGHGTEQLTGCNFADRIARLPGNLDQTGGAFMDTAAVLLGLDHVITSDTSIAHLAGSLGVPVTVMLGKVPDWRWLQSGDATPWYPSMNLIRQESLGEWSDVVQTAAKRLSDKVNGSGDA